MVDIETLMSILSKKGINKVLVEGGETVLWSFLEKRLFDEVNIFIASLNRRWPKNSYSCRRNRV
ncbi:MAG: hypothetical protein CM15mP42_07810 [Methanobacteriota archaeon]|nr:MAG: hypothetical protein CM15mP42_07810 [Euryarchaeota archaeon]